MWFRFVLLVQCASAANDLNLTNRKILVTGAAGFVGSHVAQFLLEKEGSQVVVVDEVNDYYDVNIKEGNLALLGKHDVTIYRGDVANRTLMEHIFQEEKPSVVCHMAARAGVRPSIDDPLIYVHSNVEATTVLLELSRIHNVENFVFASSSSVYGGSKEILFDESQPVETPISPYAATKKACELMGYTFHHLYNLNVTALRFFTVYGPRGRPDMAPFKFVDRVFKGVQLQQFGDGSSSRDYTYIDDIVSGIIAALKRPLGYQIINLGKGGGTKLSEFLGMVEKYVGKSANISVLPDQPGDVPYTCANITKAETLLDYNPKMSFDKGIKMTVDWYRKTYHSNETLAENSHRKQRRRRLVQTKTRRRQEGESEVLSRAWQSVPVVEPHREKKTVLVTGGAGFVGSSVAAMLLERGDDVVVIDVMNSYYNISIKEGNLKRLTSEFGTERVSIYRGDICNATLVHEIFQRHHPEWICHLAARAGVRPSIDDPLIYVSSNIEGTTNLLDISRQYNVQNFVFASSSSVYGGSTSTLFDEEEPVDYPVSPYAATKKSCELMGYTFHHLYKIPVTALRFFTVYGPHGRPDMAPFKFIDRVSRGAPIQQFGDGSSSRDYTFIDDIADGVVRAIDRPYPFQVFNLGKGSGTKLSDFVQLVEKYVGKKANIEVLPDQPGDVPYTCADVRKAYRLLGYKSTVSFEEGIRKTVEWYKLAYGIPTGETEVSLAPETSPPIATPRTDNATMHSSSSDDGAVPPDASLSVTAIVERWIPLRDSDMVQDYMPMLQWCTVLCLCFCYRISKKLHI